MQWSVISEVASMSVMQALHARAIMVVPSAQWQLPSPLSEEEAQPYNSTAFARRLVLVFSCLVYTRFKATLTMINAN